MKNSYNYSGFASAMFASNKVKKSNSKSGVIIDTKKIESDEEYLIRRCPPYLLQEAVVKPSFKK